MKENNDCGFLIKQINDRLETEANKELKESGLTISQVRYLDYLCSMHPRKVPFKELEAAFSVSQPTVVGVLSRLEKKKLVMTEQSKEDSRAKTVCMTECGYENFKNADRTRAETEHMLLEPLNSAERKELQRLLRMVYMHLK